MEIRANYNGVAEEFRSECRTRLGAVEKELLVFEQSGAQSGADLVDRLFRSLHWMAGGADLLGQVKLREVARASEETVSLIRSGRLAPTPALVRVLRNAAAQMMVLTGNPTEDAGQTVAVLAGLCSSVQTAGRERGRLRVLLVEDDFTSRLVMQTFLSRYGECHIAVNGREAVEAFEAAFERGERYDLVCMDILMPEMDGREAVRRIRGFEEAHGVLSSSGAKIVMTTTVDDIKEVIRCFMELCDAYLIKPIDLSKLQELMW